MLNDKNLDCHGFYFYDLQPAYVGEPRRKRPPQHQSKKKSMPAASLQIKISKYNNDLDDFAGNVREYLHASMLDPPCQC